MSQFSTVAACPCLLPSQLSLRDGGDAGDLGAAAGRVEGKLAGGKELGPPQEGSAAGPRGGGCRTL